MCIFCKIATGEIPSKIIYSSENTIAFLDIAPRSKGHTLVITKKHYEKFEEVPNEILCELMESIKIVLEKLKPLNYDGYNILNNNGVVAGQEIPHVHFHIIPRYKNEIKNTTILMAEPIEINIDNIFNEIKNKK